MLGGETVLVVPVVVFRGRELVMLGVDGALVSGRGCGVVVRALRGLVNVPHHGLVRGQDGTGQRLLQLLLLLPVLCASVLEPDLGHKRSAT